MGELGQIKAPTLILWGTRDVLCSRADQEALLGAITSARLVEYENAGHGLHWEEPERFAADVTTCSAPRRKTGRTPCRRQALSGRYQCPLRQA